MVGRDGHDEAMASVLEALRTRRDVMKLFGTGVAGLTAAQLLAACGGSGGASSGTTAAAIPPSQLPRGGTLRVGVGGADPKSGPDPTTAFTPASYAMAINIFDRLAERNPDFTMSLRLAEEISPASKSGDVWDVRLRDGVHFHDGKPLTPEDVIFSLRRNMNPASAGAPIIAVVDPKGMRKLDTRTVRLKLTQPVAPFKERIAQFLGVCDIYPGTFDPKKPIGTGPFKAQSIRGGERTVLVRNDNWWDGAPALERVIVQEFSDEAARANALLSGQLDAISNVPSAQLGTLSGSPSVKTLESPTGLELVFTMRVDVPPYNDVRVRQALRLLANRPQMIAQALDGRGKIGNDVLGVLEPCGVAPRQREQDVAQAKALLKAAGHEHTTFELNASAVHSGLVEGAQVFAQQASQAGVNVKVTVVDPSAWSARYAKWPFTVNYWSGGDYLSISTLAQLPNALYNDTHVDDPAWNKLYDQALAEFDAGKRCELIGRLQTIDWERGGYIAWGQEYSTDAFTDKVVGVVPDKIGLGLMSYRFWRMGINV